MMLVEINLLPQKEPGKRALFILIAGLLFIMMLVGVYYFWQIHSIKSQVESVDKQIAIMKRVEEQKNNQSITVDSANSVTQLKTAVEWANSYPIQTVPVMRQLTSLLPERGFIQNFTYNESGTVSLTVQFDTQTDAAYFLDHLNESKWMKEATMTSLNANREEEPAKTESAVDHQSNTIESNTTSQASTDANTDVGGQSNQTTAKTIVKKNDKALVKAGVDNEAVKSKNSTSEKNTDQYLPRYIAQFELTLNRNTIKDLIKNRKKNETLKDGGTGS